MIKFYSPIKNYLDKLKVTTFQIEESRKADLEQIADFIQAQLKKDREAELIFICTHNSRRSHFGQIWAKVLADYYEVSGVKTYSGGTEATAFNPHAIQALVSMGFRIEAKNSGPNPQYEVSYTHENTAIEAWSKVYSDPFNPQKDFCAIMTCSEADEACPAVFGAARRVSLPYEDPKKADDTPLEAETYLERCKQIAMEMAYVFSQLKS